MTDKSKITVVSLGPGPREYLTLGAIDALKKRSDETDGEKKNE